MAEEEVELKGGIQQIHESRGNIHDALLETFKPIKEIRNRNEKEERVRREGEEERKNNKLAFFFLHISNHGLDTWKSKRKALRAARKMQLWR